MERKFTPFNEGDAPREYVTRGGDQAFVCKKEGGYLVGMVIRKTGFRRACAWNVGGNFRDIVSCDLDLRDLPEDVSK